MPTAKHAIALVDCDSFFASCEQLIKPSLQNKPVCVLSNNDGCVVARSKEAKLLGVKMGMPAFQARKLFPQAIYLSGNLALYGEISDRVMDVLKDFSPLVEIYSIDEAFIDLTGLRKLYRKSYLDIASDIKHTVKDKVGVPVSVGVSLSKTLAKLATERAKKSDGFYKIGFREINNELKRTATAEIWGIGNNTEALLNKYGILTAHDFINQSDGWLKKVLGKKGLELKLELTGESIYPVLEKSPLPKSVQKTSSFAKFTSDKEYIKNSVHYHTHRACRKLRKLGLNAGVVCVMLRTKDFKVFYAKNALIYPSNWEFDISAAADEIFDTLFIPDIIYRSSGVTVENLSKSSDYQLSIFNPADNIIKKENIAFVWDKIDAKYGSNTIFSGYHPKN